MNADEAIVIARQTAKEGALAALDAAAKAQCPKCAAGQRLMLGQRSQQYFHLSDDDSCAADAIHRLHARVENEGVGVL